VEFLPEYQQLLPNALSLYMRLPPSHINRSQSDFIAELEVGITYSDNVAVSAPQCAARLYRSIRALSIHGCFDLCFAGNTGSRRSCQPWH